MESLQALAARVAAVVARRRQDRRQSTVFVQAVQKSDDDGKRTAAQNVRAEDTVLRAENQKRDKNPKRRVATVSKAIHK